MLFPTHIYEFGLAILTFFGLCIALTGWMLFLARREAR
jgi:hypothetical protein